MSDEGAIDPPTENAELADYQARLLDLLHHSMGRIDPSRVRSEAGPYADKLDDLDPALLQIASDLTRAWGRID